MAELLSVLADLGRGGKTTRHLSCTGTAPHEKCHGGPVPSPGQNHRRQELPARVGHRGTHALTFLSPPRGERGPNSLVSVVRGVGSQWPVTFDDVLLLLGRHRFHPKSSPSSPGFWPREHPRQHVVSFCLTLASQVRDHTEHPWLLSIAHYIHKLHMNLFTFFLLSASPL